MERNKYFLFKVKDKVTDLKGTLRVGYLEKAEFECGHYFSECNLVNSNSSISLDLNKLEQIGYDNILSILDKEDFEFIAKKNKELNDLGFGLDDPKNKEKYNKGLEILKELETIYNKLESEENKKLFDIVREQELEWCTDHWQQEKYRLGITTEDMENIFNEYKNKGYVYQDRDIINTIFENYEEIGQDWVDSGAVNMDSLAERFFDFDAFGKDIIDNNENYYEYENMIIDFNI